MYVGFLHNQGRNQTVRRDEANIGRAEGENLYGIGEGGGGYAPKAILKKLKSSGSRMLFLTYLCGYFLKVVAFFITYRSTFFVLGCYKAQRCAGGGVFSYGVEKGGMPAPLLLHFGQFFLSVF